MLISLLIFMTKVPQEIIENVLAMYKPEQRILLEADVEYPKSRGKFLIGPTYYVFSPFEHATDIDIQLCLNQLAYVSLYEGINFGAHPCLNGKDFFKLQKEGMLIIESRKRFRRAIPTDREITGELTLKELRERQGIIFADAVFQFYNRSCIGSLELAIVDR